MTDYTVYTIWGLAKRDGRLYYMGYDSDDESLAIKAVICWLADNRFEEANVICIQLTQHYSQLADRGWRIFDDNVSDVRPVDHGVAITPLTADDARNQRSTVLKHNLLTRYVQRKGMRIANQGISSTRVLGDIVATYTIGSSRGCK